MDHLELQMLKTQPVGVYLLTCAKLKDKLNGHRPFLRIHFETSRHRAIYPQSIGTCSQTSPLFLPNEHLLGSELLDLGTFPLQGSFTCGKHPLCIQARDSDCDPLPQKPGTFFQSLGREEKKNIAPCPKDPHGLPHGPGDFPTPGLLEAQAARLPQLRQRPLGRRAGHGTRLGARCEWNEGLLFGGAMSMFKFGVQFVVGAVWGAVWGAIWGVFFLWGEPFGGHDF